MDMLFSLHLPPACKSKHTGGSGFPCMRACKKRPGHWSGRRNVLMTSWLSHRCGRCELKIYITVSCLFMPMVLSRYDKNKRTLKTWFYIFSLCFLCKGIYLKKEMDVFIGSKWELKWGKSYTCVRTIDVIHVSCEACSCLNRLRKQSEVKWFIGARILTFPVVVGTFPSKIKLTHCVFTSWDGR